MNGTHGHPAGSLSHPFIRYRSLKKAIELETDSSGYDKVIVTLLRVHCIAAGTGP